ncbi:MAG: hypothetical protein AB1894_02900 [Chloroflexota bacterium]
MLTLKVMSRLQNLQEEYNRGQRQLEALDQQRQEVRDTLLRISGAIQVLEELLAQADNGAEPVPERTAPQVTVQDEPGQ